MTGTEPGLAVRLAGRLGTFELDVAFEAPARGVTALFGPSGCGKTTVLRSIAGLLDVPGTVSIAGDIWQDTSQRTFVPPHRRGIGYVFQEASLFQHLSVRDNMLYGARRAGVSREAAATALADMLDVLGIGRLVDRSPSTLSGGERQRVALGRALLARPRLLLMDEPLSALDRMTRDSILPYFERIVETLDLPIVYVSHDVTEVARLARHVVVMEAGRVVRAGATADVLGHAGALHNGDPERARKEAGATLHARIRAQHADGLTELAISGGTLYVPHIDGAIGTSVRVHVLARDVMLTTEVPQGLAALNVLSVVIDEIRADQEPGVVVRLSCGADHLLARVPGRSLTGLALETGQTCHAVLTPSACRIDRAPGGPR